MLFFCKSILSGPLLPAEKLPQTEGENFFALPALSDLPSESIYAGLNVSLLLEEAVMRNNALGTVSYMLPTEV
jgi:hypothetical protein